MKSKSLSNWPPVTSDWLFYMQNLFLLSDPFPNTFHNSVILLVSLLLSKRMNGNESEVNLLPKKKKP